VTHEIDGARTLREDEGVAQCFVNRARTRREAQKTFRFRLPCKDADRIGAARWIGEKIETLAVAPRVTRQRLSVTQPNVIRESRAGFVEELIEHPAHGEDGRPRIETQPARFDFPHLAARRVGAFDYRDRKAARGEQQSGGEAPDAGANDDDALPSHIFAHLLQPTARRENN
jgi:hypothetical protein